MILVVSSWSNEVRVDFRTERRTERHDERREALNRLVVHQKVDRAEHRAAKGDVGEDGAHH